MKQQWMLISNRIDALQLRERGMLLLAAITLVYFLFDTFGIQPLFRQQQLLRSEITDREQQLDLLRTRSDLLAGNPRNTGGTGQADDHMSGPDDRSKQWLSQMLAPNQALQILEQVVSDHPGIVLRGAVATQQPVVSETDNPENALPTLMRHDLELQLEGSFLATREYLSALEALPWKFFWDSVEFEIIKYPQARITLNLHTLSLSDG